MKHRTIRESSRYEGQKAGLSISVDRLDEVLLGATWAVARNPELFPGIPGTPYHLLVTDPFPNVPALRIFFVIEDDDYVSFEWIEEVVGDKDDPA